MLVCIWVYMKTRWPCILDLFVELVGGKSRINARLRPLMSVGVDADVGDDVLDSCCLYYADRDIAAEEFTHNKYLSRESLK